MKGPGSKFILAEKMNTGNYPPIDQGRFIQKYRIPESRDHQVTAFSHSICGSYIAALIGLPQASFALKKKYENEQQKK